MLKRDYIYKTRSENIVLHTKMPILTRLSKKLAKTGQQSNRVRLLMCNTFKAGYNNAEIALEIRRFSFRLEHFSVQKNLLRIRSEERRVEYE